MLPDQVSNPGPLTYESGVLPIALCGPAFLISNRMCVCWGAGDDDGGGGGCLCSVFYFGKVEGRLAQYPFVVCFGCRRWEGKGEINVHSYSYPS